jgi:GxxExxY protein
MVKCSLCKEVGHNSRGCKVEKNPVIIPIPVQEVKEEVIEETTTMEQPEDIKKIRKLVDEVVEALGAGHTESVYHNAMKVGLQDEGFPYESERDLPITFRGRYVGTVRADLVVDKRIVIELKSSLGSDSDVVKAIEQCRIYMKETKITQGIVVVFPKQEKCSVVFKWITL